MGPGRQGEGYLFPSDIPDTLARLDVLYVRWSDKKKKPEIFHSTRGHSFSIVWGLHEGRHLQEIGIRGRLWMLALLLAEFDRPNGARLLAEAIVSSEAESALVRDIANNIAPKEPIEALLSLISEFTRNYCPPDAVAEALFVLTVEYARSKLLKGVAEPLLVAFEQACRAPASSLSALYRSLEQIVLGASSTPRHRLGALAKTGWLDDLGDIDPLIAHEVRAESGDRSFALPKPGDDWQGRDILNALNEPSPLLIVVGGTPFAGKKGRLKAALRILAQRDDRLAFAPPGHRGAQIPIRVWAASRVHYGALVEQVATFLQEYHAAKHKTGRPLSPCPSFNDVEAVLAWIYSSCTHLPAVFVFTDTDAFRRDHARNAVRDLGIIGLIDALLGQTTSSRVIVTTGPLPADESERLSLLQRTHQYLPVPPRRNKEIRLLLPEQVQDQLPPTLLAFDDDDFIRGDDLVAVAAAIHLARENTRSPINQFEVMIATVSAFLREADDARDAPRERLYDFLVKEIVDRDLLHPVALAAASEDGVRSDSMVRLLAHWHAFDETVRPLTEAALDRELSRFQDYAKGRFLRRGRIPRYDVEEYHFCTHTSAEDQVWEVDTIISFHLLAAIRRAHPLVAERSHRLIAWIARQRSQMKKVRMRGPVAPRIRVDTPRDIQCYVNLLASMDAPNSPPSLKGPPLRMAEADMFSLDENIFNPARALRFAALLLQEDIDPGFRLTMTFDEDALRLELYLLLFQPLGSLPFTDHGPLPVPTVLPGHLTSGVFSYEELLGIMTTVGLSAFHSQEFATLDRIVTLAEGFAKKRKGKDRAVRLTRLWCCRLDAMIMLGGPIGTRGGHGETLAYLKSLQNLWFAGDAPELPEMKRARLRLLVREAELAWILDGPGEKATALFAEIEAEEISAGGNEPEILSGRGARRYLRYLLDGLTREGIGEGGLASSDRDRIITKSEILITVNEARLRRFAGTDRVGVMLDRSRLETFKGNMDEALEYARAAHVRAFAANANHGSKLDVLRVLVESYVNMIGARRESGMDSENLTGHFKSAWKAARALQMIARSRHYQPYEAAASLLSARLHALELLCHLAPEDRSRAGDGREDLTRGLAIISRIGDRTLRYLHDAAEAELTEAEQLEVS